MIFIIILHSIVCVLLVICILMQSGRGGGLTESFAAAENMFGAKTNELMVKATTVLAVLFMVLSLTLAHFSSRENLSLVDRLIKNAPKTEIKIDIPVEAPKAEQSSQGDVQPAAGSALKDTAAPVETKPAPEAVPVQQ